MKQRPRSNHPHDGGGETRARQLKHDQSRLWMRRGRADGNRQPSRCVMPTSGAVAPQRISGPAGTGHPPRCAGEEPGSNPTPSVAVYGTVKVRQNEKAKAGRDILGKNQGRPPPANVAACGSGAVSRSSIHCAVRGRDEAVECDRLAGSVGVNWPARSSNCPASAAASPKPADDGGGLDDSSHPQRRAPSPSPNRRSPAHSCRPRAGDVGGGCGGTHLDGLWLPRRMQARGLPHVMCRNELGRAPLGSGRRREHSV